MTFSVCFCPVKCSFKKKKNPSVVTAQRSGKTHVDDEQGATARVHEEARHWQPLQEASELRFFFIHLCFFKWANDGR